MTRLTEEAAAARARLAVVREAAEAARNLPRELDGEPVTTSKDEIEVKNGGDLGL